MYNKCKFPYLFPGYKCCPLSARTNRSNCNQIGCYCDGWNYEDWSDYVEDWSEEELAEAAGISVEKLRENTAKLEDYLGLSQL